MEATGFSKGHCSTIREPCFSAAAKLRPLQQAVAGPTRLFGRYVAALLGTWASSPEDQPDWSPAGGELPALAASGAGLVAGEAVEGSCSARGKQPPEASSFRTPLSCCSVRRAELQIVFGARSPLSVPPISSRSSRRGVGRGWRGVANVAFPLRGGLGALALGAEAAGGGPSDDFLGDLPVGGAKDAAFESPGTGPALVGVAGRSGRGHHGGCGDALGFLGARVSDARTRGDNGSKHHRDNERGTGCRPTYRADRFQDLRPRPGLGSSIRNATGFEPQVFTDPSVSGVDMLAFWKDMGQGPASSTGRSSTSFRTGGRRPQVRRPDPGPGGSSSPPWVFKMPKVRSLPPSWSYGGPVPARKNPVPWNDTYLAQWSHFLAAVAQRYGANPEFRMIGVGGPTSISDEMSLPGWTSGDTGLPKTYNGQVIDGSDINMWDALGSPPPSTSTPGSSPSRPTPASSRSVPRPRSVQRAHRFGVMRRGVPGRRGRHSTSSTL